MRSLENGVAVGLTHRGHKLAQIFPVRHTNGISRNDPLYQFHRHANVKAKPLSDQEMDRLISEANAARLPQRRNGWCLILESTRISQIGRSISMSPLSRVGIVPPTREIPIMVPSIVSSSMATAIARNGLMILGG